MSETFSPLVSPRRRAVRPKARPHGEKQPDPNSPFAKLMALKAQLEDNKK